MLIGPRSRTGRASSPPRRSLFLIRFAKTQFGTPHFVSRRCSLNTVAVFVTIALLG